MTKNDVGLGDAPQLLASVGGALVLWVRFQKCFVFLDRLGELLPRLVIERSGVFRFGEAFALGIFLLQLAQQSERAFGGRKGNEPEFAAH